MNRIHMCFVCILVTFICLICNSMTGQIKEPLPPQSTFTKFQDIDTESYRLKAIDIQALLEDDAQNQGSTRDMQFAIATSADLSISTAGKWDKMDEGKVWRLRIASPNALALIIVFKEFHLPNGATMHVYNDDKSHLIGAFTSRNNKGSLDSPESLLIEPIVGNTLTIEYFEPVDAEFEGVIKINQIMQAYKNVGLIKKYKGFNDSGACQVNINCPDGNAYQVSKRAVARVLITGPSGAGFCTGQMLTSGQGDFNPIFLSANHCIEDDYDAIGTNDVDMLFYWDYEAAGCSNPSSEPSSITSSGAMLMANKDDSDFALFWLLEDPLRDAGYSPTYLGWSTTTNPGAGGGCVHHPRADIKKISLYSQVPGSNASCDPNNTWNVVFNHGGGQFSSTEGGSSGSALFDNNGRVIGQLWGGTDLSSLFSCVGGPTCSDPSNDRSYYGKLSDSFGDSAGKRRRLSDWLTPACSTNAGHLGDVTNTAEFFIADNSVSSSAGIYDNSSSKATVVVLNGGNRVDLNNGFEVGSNANLTILNTADCPSVNQTESLQGDQFMDASHPIVNTEKNTEEEN